MAWHQDLSRALPFGGEPSLVAAFLYILILMQLSLSFLLPSQFKTWNFGFCPFHFRQLETNRPHHQTVLSLDEGKLLAPRGPCNRHCSPGICWCAGILGRGCYNGLGWLLGSNTRRPLQDDFFSMVGELFWIEA